MPLIDHPTLKNKKIPDRSGGWYWLQRKDQSWEPILVQCANDSGWSQGVTINTHWVDAADMDGKWGPQISYPSDKDPKIYENRNFVVQEDADGNLVISSRRGLHPMDGNRILSLKVLGEVAVCIQLRPDLQLFDTEDDSLFEVFEK